MKLMHKALAIALPTLALVALVFYNRLEAQPEPPLPERVRQLETQVAKLSQQVLDLNASIASVKASVPLPPRPVHRSYTNCKSMEESQTPKEKATEPNMCGAAYSYYGVNSKKERVCCTAQAD